MRNSRTSQCYEKVQIKDEIFHHVCHIGDQNSKWRQNEMFFHVFHML